MTDDPLIFQDAPLSVKVVFMAGVFILAPYIIVQAWREKRRGLKA